MTSARNWPRGRPGRSPDGHARRCAGDAVKAIDDKPPQLPAAGETDVNGDAPSSVASLPFIDDAQANRGAQVFFSERAFGSLGGLEQWAPGAEPILVTAPADPEIKLSALGRDPLEPEAGGETVAGKGDPALLGSPIERLKLERFGPFG